MISPNELRKGNLVSHPSADYTLSVYEIRSEWLILKSTLDGTGITAPAEDINPIILTPEILKRYGLSLRRNGIKYTGKLMYYSYTLKGIELRSMVLLDHLHQLQNLFFELTGTELSINTQSK